MIQRVKEKSECEDICRIRKKKKKTLKKKKIKQVTVKASSDFIKIMN